MPFFRQINAGEVIDVSFDFADFLERNGYPAATFTPLAASGVSVLRTQVVGSVITLTLFATAAGSSFMVGARADAGTDLSDSQFKLIYVNAAVAVEPISPPSTDFDIFVSAVDGVLLVSAVDGALLISG